MLAWLPSHWLRASCSSALAATPAGVIGGAVFLTASVLLFGTSGVYHRGTWGTRGDAILRRMDHSNIYVFIAATYTPLALILLDGTSRVILLTLIWSAALGGLFFRLFWLSAPRWLYTALYLVMGWAALGWLGAFYRAAGSTVVILIMAGGVCYTFGAVVYGRKRPESLPHLVRLSRDLPRRHHRRLRLPLRGNLHDHDLILSCSRNLWLRAPSQRGTLAVHGSTSLIVAPTLRGMLSVPEPAGWAAHQQLVGQVIDGGDGQPAHEVAANVCRGLVVDHRPVRQQCEARLVWHASHDD